MKKYILFVVISFSFFISNSQNEKMDLKQSYILTKKGKKIPIVPNEKITLKKNNITYCSSKIFKNIRFLKKDVDKKIPIKTYRYKHKDLSIKSFAKIVDQDKLYLPTEGKKTKIIYRKVLENKNHTLGYYNRRYVAGSGNLMSLVDKHRYIIIDNISKEIIDNVNMEYDGSADVIMKYFGKCLIGEELVVTEFYEPYKKFLNGEKDTKEKYAKWHKFIRGSFINLGYLGTSYLSFLPEYNQHKCE